MNDFIYNLTEKLFDSVYLSICSDLENELYKNYDVNDSDIIDYCNCNDFYFHRNGELYF